EVKKRNLREKGVGEAQKSLIRRIPKIPRLAGGQKSALLRLPCLGRGRVTGVEAQPLLAESSAQPLGAPPCPSSRKGMRNKRVRQEGRRHIDTSGEDHSHDIVDTPRA